MRIMWGLVIIGAVCGAADLALVELKAESAPQQAAGAAMACAFAVIPYVLARGAEGMRKVGDREALDRRDGR